jgi:hypothetical protein
MVITLEWENLYGLSDCHLLRSTLLRSVGLKRALSTVVLLIRSEFIGRPYVCATIHEMFSFFWMFKWFEMGDICIIQLTYSRVNRSGVYNALKSNAEHASRIYAICQWELCFPFRTQTTWRFVSQLIFLLEIRVDSWTRFGVKACMYFRFVFHMLQNNVYYFQTDPKAEMKMTDNLLRYSAV